MNYIIVSNISNKFPIIKLIDTFSQCGNIVSVNVLTSEENGCDKSEYYKQGQGSPKFHRYKIVYDSDINLSNIFEIIEIPVDGYYMAIEEINNESKDSFNFSSNETSSTDITSPPSTPNSENSSNKYLLNEAQVTGVRGYCHFESSGKQFSDIPQGGELEEPPSYEDAAIPKKNDIIRKRGSRCCRCSRLKNVKKNGFDKNEVSRLDIISYTISQRRKRGIIRTLFSMTKPCSNYIGEYFSCRYGSC